MATTQTFVPKGFTAGRNPMISPALAARVERLGRRSGPQRLVALKCAAAKAEAVEGFLAAKPMWGAWLKAPGLYEIDAFVEDIAEITARKDLFQWVDVATRFMGKILSGAAVTAMVRLSVTDVGAAESRVKDMGGTVTAHLAGAVEAKVPAGRMAGLLRSEKIEAIEVLGAA